MLIATSIRCNSNVPLDICCTSKFPAVVNCKRSISNPRNPICIQKKILCKSCENACEIDRMYEIAYKNVMKANEEEIPYLIKRSHPKLGFSDYLTFKTDHNFLNRILMVCDECYLSYIKKPKIIKTEYKPLRANHFSKTPTPLLLTERNIKTPSDKTMTSIRPKKSIKNMKTIPTQRVLPKMNYPPFPEFQLKRSAASLIYLKTIK